MDTETISSEEARKDFKRLLNAAQYKGTETVITRYGETAGRLVPPDWVLVPPDFRDRGAEALAVVERMRLQPTLPAGDFLGIGLPAVKDAKAS